MTMGISFKIIDNQLIIIYGKDMKKISSLGNVNR